MNPSETPIKNAKISIEFSRKELTILSSSLNEVLNGIGAFEFETRIGSENSEVIKLLEMLNFYIDNFNKSEQPPFSTGH